MQKIIIMAEEFFRSFKNSIFKNLILMVMFSISLVMAVLMSSYYFDLNERDEDAAKYSEDGLWYDLQILHTDFQKISESFDTATGCRNMIDYYDNIHNLEEYSVFSMFTQQNMLVREDDFNKLFNQKSYSGFLSENHPTAFSAYFGAYGEKENICSVLGLKSAHLDLKAYKLFGLRTQEGQGFTEDNMTIEHAVDSIPVILGSEYKGIIPVGQILEIGFAGTDYIYPCRVVGILEDGAHVPMDGYANGDIIMLDSYIIFPYGISIVEKSDVVENVEKYAFLDTVALDNGAVRVEDEGEFVKVVSLFREIGERYELPPIQMDEASVGLKLLGKESSTRIRIILILTIALVSFSFYGLFVTFYDKIQSNKGIYGIYLMNGCSLKMILIPCLFEIVITLLPAVFVCDYVFKNLIQLEIGEIHTDVIMNVACSFAGLAVLVGAIFIVVIMRGVDMEHLVRPRE